MITMMKQQRGSALIVSLGILTAITLGAMVAMQRSGVQIRMITNLQHEQELKNATLSTLNYLYTQMETNGALQNQILGQAETLYKQSLVADPTTGQSPSPAFNPFKTFGALRQPAFSAKSISGGVIDTQIQNLPVPSGNNFFLKGKGGCGSGCSVMHASLAVNATARNGIMTTGQEMGVRRLIPGTGGQ